MTIHTATPMRLAGLEAIATARSILGAAVVEQIAKVAGPGITITLGGSGVLHHYETPRGLAAGDVVCFEFGARGRDPQRLVVTAIDGRQLTVVPARRRRADRELPPGWRKPAHQRNRDAWRSPWPTGSR